MIQSHLLQIMALMAIEPPASVDERDLRDAVATVLRASSIKAPYAKSTRRARYTAGSIGGRTVPDYAKEEGVDAARGTETLAEVRGGDRQLALAGRAVHPALRQGPGQQTQGSRGDLPAGAAPAQGLHRGGLPQPAAGSASGRTPCSSTST